LFFVSKIRQKITKIAVHKNKLYKKCDFVGFKEKTTKNQKNKEKTIDKHR